MHLPLDDTSGAPWAANIPNGQWWAKWRFSTFDLYPWGEGHGVQGQICDILRPQLAMNCFLSLWPHRFPHFGSWGGSDIRSMSSIRPICKCRCRPLLMVYSGGLGGNLFMKKTRSRKSCDTVSLIMENLRFLQSYNKEKPTHEVRAHGPCCSVVNYYSSCLILLLFYLPGATWASLPPSGLLEHPQWQFFLKPNSWTPIALRFLDISLRVLRHEVPVWIS